jgi:hypothetical protein
MAYWYISFANTQGFRGATVVKAISANSALAEATRRGLNPGGEAAILQIPKHQENESDVIAMTNRLLTVRRMEALGAKPVLQMPPAIQNAFDADAEKVCAQLNRVRHRC